MIKSIYKIFNINRIGESRQYKTNEGKYIDIHGHIYFIKGVGFNSAKFKTVYKYNKKCAFKYTLDTIKSIFYNIIYINKANNKKILLS